MQPSQQRKEWAALGLEVARVLQADRVQAPEGHVEADGQVRGYLRWYGDLTALTGYAPLAEAISIGLQKKRFEKEELGQLQSCYAKEWDTPVSYVHGAIHNTIQTAFDCHPAFASLVLGGIGRAVTTLRFVQASMEWLKEYNLAPRFFAGDEREAAWQKTVRPAWDTPFISMEEKEIVASIGQGEAVAALSERLGYSTERIEQFYTRAIERATYLLNTVPTQPLEEPADDIAAGLKKIGFALHTPGVTELRTAIRLARDNPKLLDLMQDGLYSAVGEEFGLEPGAVSYRIRGALRIAYKWCRQTGEHAGFYRDSGLLEQPFSAKRFLAAFLLYESQTRPACGGGTVEDKKRE